jgi:tetratricopeptide (TPR) repeat protein
MKPHAFVAMPFGTKPVGTEPDNNGKLIDFNRVYSEYIKPAIEAAGLTVFRADKEQRAGDIRTDMFQELLLADLVVVDLTINNPNVWYELGVRHALRSRGVVLVCGGRVTTAFDIYTDRKLHYSLKGEGPDPDTIKDDIRNLTQMVKETMQSWHGRKVSPVYNLMPNLKEPDWKSLRIGDVLEFWEKYDAWQDRIALAGKAGSIGDILVLAEEAPVAAFRADAWIKAGQYLRKAKHFKFAFELLERGLEVEPCHLMGLQEKGICLQRLALQNKPEFTLDRARLHYRNVLDGHPNDSETWALLGRLDKDAWVASWRQEGASTEQMRKDAAYEDALMRGAIESYLQGYRRNLAHYYSGINALTLMHLYQHLTKDNRYESQMKIMSGAVRFAAECETDEDNIYWAKATLGDIEVLLGTADTVKASYKVAIAKNEKDWFALDSCRDQLQLLKALGFNPETVDAGIETFDRALKKLQKPQDKWQPRKVFLFSGHMVDQPNRHPPRFPPAKVADADRKIAEALEQLDAGPEDLALTQGACGGDLLFTEACQSRGVRVHWLQPFDEPEFIQNSVIRGGELWRGRYLDPKAKLDIPPISAPERLGAPPKGAAESYPYERCNLWLLYTALSYGIEKVHFICLWNGEGGDSPGGTAHMYNEVKNRTAQVRWIDTRDL